MYFSSLQEYIQIQDQNNIDKILYLFLQLARLTLLTAERNKAIEVKSVHYLRFFLQDIRRLPGSLLFP